MAQEKKLEEAKMLYKDANADQRYVLELLFPELKESESKKIKNVLIDYFNRYKEQEECGIKTFYGIPTDNIIAWLEKQGEQKHKFNIGDIISNGQVVYRVDDITKNCIGQDCYFLVNVEYEKNRIQYLSLTDSEGKHSNVGEVTLLCDQADKSFEKQGQKEEPQVYEAEDGEIITYSETDGYKVVEPKFKVGDTMRTLQEAADGYTDGMPVVISVDKEYYHCTNELIAIKDQDDYEYPPMNRIQTPTDKVEPKFKVGDKIISTISNIPYYITEVCNGHYLTDVGCVIMFNAQDNFELFNQGFAWSEEDEIALGDALWCCKQAASIAKNENDMGNCWYAETWLKSLKERVGNFDDGYKVGFSAAKHNQWKPSDEQMNFLEELVEDNNQRHFYTILRSLYEQLKELREE